MDQVEAVSDRGAKRPAEAFDRGLDGRERQTRRAEDPEHPGAAHRLDDLDRADPVGHRPRDVGEPEPVFVAERGVAHVFERTGGEVTGDALCAVRCPVGLDQLQATRPFHNQERVAHPSQGSFQRLVECRGNQHRATPPPKRKRRSYLANGRAANVFPKHPTRRPAFGSRALRKKGASRPLPDAGFRRQTVSSDYEFPRLGRGALRALWYAKDSSHTAGRAPGRSKIPGSYGNTGYMTANRAESRSGSEWPTQPIGWPGPSGSAPRPPWR